jgi:hypothetical protein
MDVSFFLSCISRPEEPSLQPWKEKWTVAACEQRVNVMLKFTPSGKRTRVKEIAGAIAAN